MNIRELLELTRTRGVEIRLRGGDVIASGPRGALTPVLVDELRSRKEEIRKALLGFESRIPPTARPQPIDVVGQALEDHLDDVCLQDPRVREWLHIARQVIQGEFAGADRSTVDSLKIGLRGIGCASAREAMRILEGMRPKPAFRRRGRGLGDPDV